MNLPQPTVEIVREYVCRFEKEGYGAIEKALEWLFRTFPKNNELGQVLIKAAALNDLYNTNIYAIDDMARHICGLGIDSRLRQRSLDLVEEIAVVEVGGKRRRNYSFATKYCSFHVPDAYPMYDGYVDAALWAFKKRDGFAEFKRKEMWESYPRYVEVIEAFRDYYGLEQFSLREIDRFLWFAGRDLEAREEGKGEKYQ